MKKYHYAFVLSSLVLLSACGKDTTTDTTEPPAQITADNLPEIPPLSPVETEEAFNKILEEVEAEKAIKKRPKPPVIKEASSLDIEILEP